MMSNGLISFWEKNAFRKFKLKELKNHKKKNQDDVHSVDNNDDDVAILSLNMSQLQSSYYFMVTGISISFLALFIEIGIYKRKRNGIKK